MISLRKVAYTNTIGVVALQIDEEEDVIGKLNLSIEEARELLELLEEWLPLVPVPITELSAHWE